MGRRNWRLGWLGGAIALSLAESDGSDSDSGSSDSDSGDSDSDSGSGDSSGDEAMVSMSYGSDSSYYSNTPSDDSSTSGDGTDQQRRRKRVRGEPGAADGLSDDDLSDIPGG